MGKLGDLFVTPMHENDDTSQLFQLFEEFTSVPKHGKYIFVNRHISC